MNPDQLNKDFILGFKSVYRDEKLNNKVKREYILYDMSSKTYYDILRIRKVIDIIEVPEKMETTWKRKVQ